MICDAEKEIGIAGIMGGDNSKITDEVTTVLFEAACLRRNQTSVNPQSGSVSVLMHPVNLKKVWIRDNAEDAINSACQLIEELGCGDVVGGMVDVYAPLKRAGPHVHLMPEKYQ